MTIIAGNFKANLTRIQVATFAKELDSILTDMQTSSHLQVDIFPSHTALLTNNFKRLIIGHSERRTLFGENQDFINKKFRFYAEAGFEIYYCIGEPLSVRQKGKNALKDFLGTQLNGIDITYPKLIIAYEPIWAIGTGESATLEQIESTHSMLATFTSAPLLYGGSVNPTNAREILCTPYVNGVLVGSASLNIQSFTDIIRASK